MISNMIELYPYALDFFFWGVGEGKRQFPRQFSKIYCGRNIEDKLFILSLDLSFEHYQLIVFLVGISHLKNLAILSFSKFRGEGILFNYTKNQLKIFLTLEGVF